MLGHTPPNTTPFGSAPFSSTLSEDVMASLVEKLTNPSAASIWSAFATTTTTSTTTGANLPSTGVAHQYGTPESDLDLTRLQTPSPSVYGRDSPLRSLTLCAERNTHTDLDQQRFEADHMFNAFVQMPPGTGTTAADARSAHNHNLGLAVPPPLPLPLPVSPFDDAFFRQGTAITTTPTAAAAAPAAVNEGPIVPQPMDEALAATLLAQSLLMASLLGTYDPAALVSILTPPVSPAAASSHSSVSSSSSAVIAAITPTKDQDVPKEVPESVALEPAAQVSTSSLSPPPSPSPVPRVLRASRPLRVKAVAAVARSSPRKRRTSATAAALTDDNVEEDKGSRESEEGGGKNLVVKSAEEKEADGQRASSSNDAVITSEGDKDVVAQDEDGKIEVPKTKGKGKGKGKGKRHNTQGKIKGRKNKGDQGEGWEDVTSAADSTKDQHEPAGKHDEAADGHKGVLTKDDDADDSEDEPIMLPTNTRKTVTKCPLLPVVLPYPKNMIRPDEPILPPRGSGQKRAREDDDDDDDSTLTPTEKMLRDRRLRNTISARMSRARKQAKIEVLEAEGTRLAQQLQESEMQVQQLTQLVMAKDQVIMSLTGGKDAATLASADGAQSTVAISAAAVAALLAKVSALEEHVAHLATEGKGRDLASVGAAFAVGGEA